MVTKQRADSALELVRELIQKSAGKKVVGKDNIIFRIKLFAELLDGDQKGGWLLNQILYWSDRTDDPEGWFWKTYAEWYAETGLTEREIRRIVKGDKRRQNPKKTLQDVGVVVAVRRAPTGSPTTHYRLDRIVFFAVLVDHLERNYDLQLQESHLTDGQIGICPSVKLETDHCAEGETPASLYDKDSESIEKESSQLSPTPPPEDDDLTILLSWEKQFGKIPNTIKSGICNQLRRLGREKTREIAERCAQKGGRSWYYVLKALENEMPEKTGCVNLSGNKKNDEDIECNEINEPEEDEETYEQMRARVRAEEEAIQRRLYPPLEPTVRVQTLQEMKDGTKRSAQDIWAATCERLQRLFDPLDYKLLLGDATLVDFEVDTRTFIVVIRRPRNSSKYQIIYQTAYNILAGFYGHRKIDLCFWTRDVWQREQEYARAQSEGAAGD